LKKLVVFASGSGTNFQAVIDAIQSGYLKAQVTGLIASKAGIGAIKRARNNNIPVEIHTPQDTVDHLIKVLNRWSPDLIILAGYLQKIPIEVINQYPRKIINIHPSLLPQYGGKGYYGKKVHEAVIQNNETVSGCSVHFVTDEYDEGPVIDQIEVPVKKEDTADTLATKVLEKEHILLPRVIKQLINNNKKPTDVSLHPLTELPKSNLSIKRALLSVSDKTGITKLAGSLHAHNIEIISTGGTAKAISDAGIPVTDISEVTGFPECLDGRVKTLHPHVHAAILARTSYDPDSNELEKLNIEPIELVVVNLYPFEDTIVDDRSLETATEYIDIGGPTLLRAAAKNFAHVGVLTSPGQYNELTEILESDGGLTFNKRLAYAKAAFQHTANYDAAIAGYFEETSNEPDDLPEQLRINLPKADDLRYGENPQQRAAVYGDQGSFIDCFHGKALSFNNYLDVDGALRLMSDFEHDDPTCAIFKHTVPCGVATAGNLAAAYQSAFATDTMSPFGGIIIVNRPLDIETARKIDEIFTEIIIAPAFDEETLNLLQQKKKRRLIRYRSLHDAGQPYSYSSIFGGALYQEKDNKDIDPDTFKTVTERKPTDQELQNLLFAWKVVKHVKSNAIVYARERRTLGIGTGQPSRVDSSEVAIAKAAKENLSLDNSAIASDAFFPFADGVEAAAKAGATCVIQPGGSIRDQEVIDKANKHDMAMIFTNQRHFRH